MPTGRTGDALRGQRRLGAAFRPQSICSTLLCRHAAAPPAFLFDSEGAKSRLKVKRPRRAWPVADKPYSIIAGP
jgi:hypothetical protein